MAHMQQCWQRASCCWHAVTVQRSCLCSCAFVSLAVYSPRMGVHHRPRGYMLHSTDIIPCTTVDFLSCGADAVCVDNCSAVCASVSGVFQQQSVEVAFFHKAEHRLQLETVDMYRPWLDSGSRPRLLSSDCVGACHVESAAFLSVQVSSVLVNPLSWT
jgi:hypothetical protein